MSSETQSLTFEEYISPTQSIVDIQPKMFHFMIQSINSVFTLMKSTIWNFLCGWIHVFYRTSNEQVNSSVSDRIPVNMETPRPDNAPEEEGDPVTSLPPTLGAVEYLPNTGMGEDRDRIPVNMENRKTWEAIFGSLPPETPRPDNAAEEEGDPVTGLPGWLPLGASLGAIEYLPNTGMEEADDPREQHQREERERLIRLGKGKLIRSRSDIKDAVNLWFENRGEAVSRYGHISMWNTSQVTDMTALFACRRDFNEDIGDWDVSNVCDMDGMFEGASSFNQPLERWNVSNVCDMYGMFDGASSFNQPLERWDVTDVRDMANMFSGASSFNQPLENWNVSNVTTMWGMFQGASSFNQALGNWNVAKVRKWDDESMFYGASSFNSTKPKKKQVKRKKKTNK